MLFKFSLFSAAHYQYTIHDIPNRQSTPTSSSCASSLPYSLRVCKEIVKIQKNLSTSNEETCTDNESKTQKIIDKYIQDLNKLLCSGGNYQGKCIFCKNQEAKKMSLILFKLSIKLRLHVIIKLNVSRLNYTATCYKQGTLIKCTGTPRLA